MLMLSPAEDGRLDKLLVDGQQSPGAVHLDPHPAPRRDPQAAAGGGGHPGEHRVWAAGQIDDMGPAWHDHCAGLAGSSRPVCTLHRIRPNPRPGRTSQAQVRQHRRDDSSIRARPDQPADTPRRWVAGEPAAHPCHTAAAGQRQHEPSAVRQLVQPTGVHVAAVVAHSVDPLRAVVGQRVSVGVEQSPPQRTGRRRDNLYPIRRSGELSHDRSQPAMPNHVEPAIQVDGVRQPGDPVGPRRASPPSRRQRPGDSGGC